MITKGFLRISLHSLLASIFLLLSLIAIPAHTENSQSSDNCCKRIDREHASLYIQYERTDVLSKEDRKETIVWLRLRNNTSCPVRFQTVRNYHRLVDGKIDNAIQDGQDVEVYYEIETETGRERSYRGDFFTIFRLLPGRSIVFFVPGRYFIRSSTIVVPFGYVWEDWPIGLNTRNEVIYTRSELPPGWDEKRIP